MLDLHETSRTSFWGPLNDSDVNTIQQLNVSQRMTDMMIGHHRHAIQDAQVIYSRLCEISTAFSAHDMTSSHA